MPQKPYRRRFEYIKGKSRKFWEFEVINWTMITRWGRIGTTGQAMTEQFTENIVAINTANLKAQGKLLKGYLEVGIADNPLAQKASEAIALVQNNQRTNTLVKLLRPRNPRTKKTTPTPPSAPLPLDVPFLVKPKRKVRI